MLKHFRQIDIEYQSFCNRQCEWCPNALLDRHSFNSVMDQQLFEKIIKEIIENNFDQTNHSVLKLSKTLSFKGFTEPFSNINIFKKYLDICHQYLPSSIFIEASTNGDYLSKENLEGLYLNQLNIMDYDNKGESYWLNKMAELECAYIHPATKTEKLSFIHESINLIQVSLNWEQTHKKENRGGILTQYNSLEKRRVDCPEISYYLSIDFQGNVMPCCHMRADCISHAPYILGNLQQQTIKEILTSDKYLSLKEIMQNKNDFKGIPGVCDYCDKIRMATLKYSPDGYNYVPLSKRKEMLI